MKIIAVINARATSSKLLGNPFARTTDVLQTCQIIIQRARLRGLEVVFGTRDGASDDRLASLVAAYGAADFCGAQHNKIQFGHDTLTAHDADAMVGIDGDELAVNKMFVLAPEPEKDTDVVSFYIKATGRLIAELPLNDDECGLDVRLTLDCPEDVGFFCPICEATLTDTKGSEIAEKALKLEFVHINWHRQGDFLLNQQQFNEQVNI
jgi:hypothetical protein